MASVRAGLILTAGAAGAALFLSSARAQDVNGLPNADVRPGYSSLGARFVYDPPQDGEDEVFASQFGYQRNFGDKWSLSGAGFFSNRGPGGYQFRALQPGVQFQFAESEQWGGDGSILLFARIPDKGDGPGRVALLLAGKWILHEDWEIRALAAASRDWGENARDGVGLSGRAEVTRRVGVIGRLGAQFGDNFNTTSHFGAFKDQSHQAGPVFKTVVGENLNVSAVVLFGVSAAAPDTEFKLFLTYDL